MSPPGRAGAGKTPRTLRVMYLPALDIVENTMMDGCVPARRGVAARSRVRARGGPAGRARAPTDLCAAGRRMDCWEYETSRPECFRCGPLAYEGPWPPRAPAPGGRGRLPRAASLPREGAGLGRARAARPRAERGAPRLLRFWTRLVPPRVLNGHASSLPRTNRTRHCSWTQPRWSRTDSKIRLSG
jgi:hypothetical protein